MGAQVSIVVVSYEMARELPRTLATLSPTHQVGVDAADYEVIVVDNGSPTPVDPRLIEEFDGNIRLVRLDPAPPSPARAANVGIGRADGDLIGLIIDGARMASPGLVATARLGQRLADRPVITAPAWHLGAVPHMRAAEHGYDQTVEDELLTGCGWERDGYALFEVATFAGSSHRGWFGPMGESSSLFMPRSLWQELGGLDQAFDLPGGGLVNHDLYRRACALDGSTLVYLLGEGTFHQFHGGAATAGRFTWDEMHAQYQSLRGARYQPPPDHPLYLGRVPDTSLEHLGRSVALAQARLSDR